MAATIAFHLSSNGFHKNEWIVGVLEGKFLKMIRLRITDANTFDWIKTKVTNNFDNSCLTEFTESCFAGTDRTEDIYGLKLATEGKSMIEFIFAIFINVLFKG